ncbi:MAG: propionyl-coenzyme A carboxylase alpha polypeptide [Mesorhizobium sp.]|nr:MAG: propionyl-coenzyme A carboxylase alpha polypeptide [Mesorhizobium sp.]TIP71385.1 MAG: propionyl-coenzyme A carboxylase alpha polypeptide [Mesorhizobium sp.]TIQ08580.1 MAG: propionyl-coenzyme A carboxylase alpha polypeptide [Mesorhizobium sp.]TIR49991.1 MAG: propionyl-coenzyme A carboxylase alpha polypeptide [Mesorhizobium sp.]TJV95908.1 MAG: propionyl-coenzyme A carboxylase alpha polypeptide [Mesorhizobium sp.]
MTPAGQRPPVLPDISPTCGRSAVIPVFANLQNCSRSAAPKLPISPLMGEMVGRPEGGAKDRQPLG